MNVRARDWNPPNRFDPVEIDWEEPPPSPHLEVIEDHSQSILSTNDSPDIGFRWSVNPYRGCTHACAYCYARPNHEYLGLGAGSDFERRIVVKPRAAELLEAAFRSRSWAGELVMFSGVTDCYQPLERRYALTRACLEVAARFRNPVGVITRSGLITRDLDVLLRLQREASVTVTFSIPIPDPELQRVIEPGAPPASVRLRAMRTLADAGIPVGVSVAPIIPGLNDHLVPEALQRAWEAGARWAWPIALRLPGAVAAVFEARLREALPLRADRVMNGIRAMRGGALNDARFGSRMKGTGESWEATEALFDVWQRKLGFARRPPAAAGGTFRVPGRGVQMGLFG